MVINSTGDSDDKTTRGEDDEPAVLDVYEVTDSRGRTMQIKLTAEQAKARDAKKVGEKAAPTKSRSTTTKARKPSDK